MRTLDRVLVLGLFPLSCARLMSSHEIEASSATYVRTDSNDTTVVSPRAHTQGVLGETLLFDAAYGMDGWTSASIDIVTAATPTVREIRHEVSGGAGYRGKVLTFHGGYRHSNEPDYVSHAGTVRAAVELFQKNTTLAIDAFGAHDTVGRFGDPSFDEVAWTGGARLTYTQIIDKKTLGEISWETTRVGGFQSSPYRWVAIGGDGTCRSDAAYCIPENNPTERWRNAVNVRFRRALGERFSLGLEYRYYFDSWAVQSHTLHPSFAVLAGGEDPLRDIFTVRYRYYTQGEAVFYRPRYFELDETSGYVTRDRKLSAMFVHTAAIDWVHRFPTGNIDIQPLVGITTGYSYIRYLAFVGLPQVHVVELTGMFGAEFR